MAEQFPESRFIGIDLSQRRVLDGQATIEAIGLTNVELQQKNILDIGPEFGQFDYVIVHGVYSWVLKSIQDKILDICSRNLRPDGAA